MRSIYANLRIQIVAFELGFSAKYRKGFHLFAPRMA
jgi:hypothetical protein